MNITHNFNQDDLDTLINEAVTYYHMVETTDDRVGALYPILADYPAAFMDKYDQHMKLGYTRAENPYPQFQTLNGNGYFKLWLVKPESEQVADIEAIKEQVAAEYKAELGRRYDLHLEAVVAESLVREQRKEEKKAADLLAKQTALATEQAIKALGERPV